MFTGTGTDHQDAHDGQTSPSFGDFFQQVLELLLLRGGEASKALVELVGQQRQPVRGGPRPAAVSSNRWRRKSEGSISRLTNPAASSRFR